MFALTDELAVPHYCACLVFHESVSVQPLKHDDEDIDEDSLNVIEYSYSGINQITKSNEVHQVMYAPKCLLIISRHNSPKVLKDCLTIIYTVYIDNIDVKIENLVTNLLAGIQVPPPGGNEIVFSLGAGDKQVYQPPQTSTIPITGTGVYDLFNQLGIAAAVNVLIGLMTENKILVMSRSYTQIYNACHAMVSLMYPFVYSHIYIPILPACLLDFIASPTPYLMGIHSSLKSQKIDLVCFSNRVH